MITIGETFGTFHIKSEIGHGGMGTIFHAVDTMLDREVALKIIHPQLTYNAQLMERFKIEAMTQARMNHPNIVMIFSFTRIEDDYVIAMEYIAGRSLKDILAEKRRLTPAEAFGYLEQVLGGLKYAHAHAVIHRDIKPANIMVANDGTVKLSDFGIAKVLGTQGVTKTGMMVGTPWYTSPEQILGREIDFRSDIYSLGISFYEMLTGRVPFDSGTNSDFQIQKAHLETPPPRPSAFNPEIGLILERFILKALQKDPDKRFQSAAEMLDELHRLKAEFARPSQVDIPTERLGARKPSLLSVFRSPLAWVAVALLLVSGGLLLVLREGRRPAAIPPAPQTTVSGMTTVLPPMTRGQAAAPARRDQGEVQRDPARVASGSTPPSIEPRPRSERDLTAGFSPAGEGPGPSSVADRSIPAPGREEPPPLRPRAPRDSSPDPIRLRSLIENRNWGEARRLAEQWADTTDPRLFPLLGRVRLQERDYRGAESFWSRALLAGETVAILCTHYHPGSVTRCPGFLRIRRQGILFDARNRPEHSFRVRAGQIRSVRATPEGVTIEADLDGESMRETLSLFVTGERRPMEAFLAAFLQNSVK